MSIGLGLGSSARATPPTRLTTNPTKAARATIRESLYDRERGEFTSPLEPRRGLDRRRHLHHRGLARPRWHGLGLPREPLAPTRQTGGDQGLAPRALRR